MDPRFSPDFYSYDLPEELIAQRPAEPRDSSRLLVVDRARGTIEHRRFADFPGYFGEKDVLVANNSRVIKARLLGRRLREERGAWVSGGAVEFVLLEKVGPDTWEGLFKASAKYVPGLRFEVPTPDGRGLRAELVRGSADSPSGTVVARFERDPLASGAGELPLPHYIRHAPTASDETGYQTLYAKNDGSAAAPTAGLHFTPAIAGRLRERGAGWEEITLHVGLGTFRPVKVADLRSHAMHEEVYTIDEATASRLNAAKAAGRGITAVGTTTVRTLEAAWRAGGGALAAGTARTSIFIYPGEFRFQAVDRILTNFHLPRSTLLMLVCAFAGRELVLEAYAQAVREKYRFFSYGDAMLLY